MHEHELAGDHRAPTPNAERPGGGGRTPASRVLELQRSAGNAATTHALMLGRVDARRRLARDVVTVSPGSSRASTERRGVTYYPVEERVRRRGQYPPDLRPVVDALQAALEEWERFRAHGDGPDTARNRLFALADAWIRRHVVEPGIPDPLSPPQTPFGFFLDVPLSFRDDLAAHVGAQRLAVLGDLLRWDRQVRANRGDGVRKLFDNARDFENVGTRFPRLTRPVDHRYELRTGRVEYGTRGFAITSVRGTAVVHYRNDMGMRWHSTFRFGTATNLGVEALLRRLEQGGVRLPSGRVWRPDARLREWLREHAAQLQGLSGIDASFGASGEVDTRRRPSGGVGFVEPLPFVFANARPDPARAPYYFSPSDFGDSFLEIRRLSGEFGASIGGHGFGRSVILQHNLIFHKNSNPNVALRFEPPGFWHQSEQPGGNVAGGMLGGRIAWLFAQVYAEGPVDHPVPRPVPPRPRYVPRDTRRRTGRWRRFLVAPIQFPSGSSASAEITPVTAEVIRRGADFLRAHPDYVLRMQIRGHATPRWRRPRGQTPANRNLALSEARIDSVTIGLREEARNANIPPDVLDRFRIPRMDPESDEFPAGSGSAEARAWGVGPGEDPPEWRRVDIVVEYSEYEIERVDVAAP